MLSLQLKFGVTIYNSKLKRSSGESQDGLPKIKIWNQIPIFSIPIL